LSGIDVARKILILIREAVMKWKEDIENESFLPAACMETTNNADFFKSIVEHATHFEAILAEVIKESRLKFVAQFENGKKRWFTIHPKDHPFITWKEKTISYCSLRIVMSINLYY
jgi:aspartokinase/homoserine dehydrogenase 1